MLKKLFLSSVIALTFFSLSCDQERGQVLLIVSSITPTSSPFGDTLSKTGTIPTDTVEFTLMNQYKNLEPLQNSTYADILIDTVTVTFNRVDGGSDSPANYRTAVAYRVPANGSLAVENFTVVPATMKAQFPISDLIFFGYERSTNFLSIKMDVVLEFSGKTVEGDPVYARGHITIEFADWAD